MDNSEYHLKTEELDKLIDAKQNLMSDKLSDFIALKHELEQLQEERKRIMNQMIFSNYAHKL